MALFFLHDIILFCTVLCKKQCHLLAIALKRPQVSIKTWSDSTCWICTKRRENHSVSHMPCCNDELLSRPLPLFLRNGDHQRFCSEILNVNMVDASLKWDDNSSSSSFSKSSSCPRKSASCSDVVVLKDRKEQQQLPKILSLDEIPISVETIIWLMSWFGLKFGKIKREKSDFAYSSSIT